MNRPPFKLSDDQLKTLISAYLNWQKKSEEQEAVNKRSLEAEKIKDTFLDKDYLEKVSKEDFVARIFEYIQSLEGPAGIRLGTSRVTNTSEDLIENLKYLLESKDDPYEKAKNILKGDRHIKYFGRSFWTPIFQEAHPDSLPLWNNQTDELLEKLGIDLRTQTTSFTEKYKLLNDVFAYLINHLMHFGGAVDEGKSLLKQLSGARALGKKGNFTANNLLLTKKKQIILYGPPGTGKTYRTKKIAIDLIYDK